MARYRLLNRIREAANNNNGGNGSANYYKLSDYVSLATAIANIGSINAILDIDTLGIVDSALTVPATLLLKSQGSVLTKSGSGTIAFEGIGLDNPESQHPLFLGFNPGDITWTGNEHPRTISIELFDTGDDSLNKRINLVDAALSTVTRTVSGINTTSNEITTSAPHGFTTGDELEMISTATLPATDPANEIFLDVPVFAIVTGASTLKLAINYTNAIAETEINITSAGSGTITLNRWRPATIVCYPRTISNPGSVIQEHHTLLFKAGNYPNEIATQGSTNYAAFMLKDNTTMTADGHAILHESPVDGNGKFVVAWTQSFAAPQGSPELGCKNIVVEKLHFLGNPNQVEISGSNAAVLLGNCTNSYIRFNTFERLKAYAAGLGGSSFVGLGWYARDSGIHNNTFIGCEAQNAFIINGESCFVSWNYFDMRGAAGGAVIDVEPNAELDRADNITVEGNVIDVSRATGSFGGIAAQCAGSTATHGIFIRNNQILGRDISSTAGLGSLSSGITVIGYSHGVVENNFVRTASGLGMSVWGCRNLTVKNNTMMHCTAASGNGDSIQILHSTDCHIEGNVNSESDLMPFTASKAIYEGEIRLPAVSSGSVISNETVGAYRLFTYHAGLNVWFNGALYEIDSVDISVYPHAVTMTASVGTAANVVAASATDVSTGADTIAKTSHGLNNGCLLQYTAGTASIGGLTSGAYYWVVNRTANNFQLALTEGGATIDLTSTGTGNQTFKTILETRFSSNSYARNTAQDGHRLEPTGASLILSTAEDRKVTTVANIDHTASSASGIILYTSLSTGRTVTLPTAKTCKGKEIVIKDGSGQAGTHNITIDGNSDETIDGAATNVISTNYGVRTVKSTGTGWITL